MKVDVTLAEIANCSDNEIIGTTTAIVDGPPGPHVGLQEVPVTAGSYRNQALESVREGMWTYLLAGGSPDVLRSVCDETIARSRC